MPKKRKRWWRLDFNHEVHSRWIENSTDHSETPQREQVIVHDGELLGADVRAGSLDEAINKAESLWIDFLQTLG